MTDIHCPQPNPLQKLVSGLSVKREFSDRLDYGLRILDPMSTWVEGNQGQGVKVSVLDTGCYGHPDLSGAIVKRQDFTGEGIEVTENHGTSVAGVIGARLNDKGTVGVAPRCEILSGKVLGEGGRGSMNALAQGIEWAVQSGADIINMSLGGGGTTSRLRQAIREAHLEGVVLIAASGNAGNEDPSKMDFPAKHPEVISVGAIEKGKHHADYSNAGCEIVAPGSMRYVPKIPDGYYRASGTSFASPSVSGVVALYLVHEREQGNDPSPEDVRTALHETAHDMLDPGKGPLTGWGMVSVPRMMSGQPH